MRFTRDLKYKWGGLNTHPPWLRHCTYLTCNVHMLPYVTARGDGYAARLRRRRPRTRANRYLRGHPENVRRRKCDDDMASGTAGRRKKKKKTSGIGQNAATAAAVTVMWGSGVDKREYARGGRAGTHIFHASAALQTNSQPALTSRSQRQRARRVVTPHTLWTRGGGGGSERQRPAQSPRRHGDEE